MWILDRKLKTETNSHPLYSSKSVLRKELNKIMILGLFFQNIIYLRTTLNLHFLTF